MNVSLFRLFVKKKKICIILLPLHNYGFVLILANNSDVNILVWPNSKCIFTASHILHVWYLLWFLLFKKFKWIKPQKELLNNTLCCFFIKGFSCDYVAIKPVFYKHCATALKQSVCSADSGSRLSTLFSQSHHQPADPHANPLGLCWHHSDSHTSGLTHGRGRGCSRGLRSG